MALTHKALWSFLVGTLAAVPMLHGLREVSPATPAEVKAEATAPDTETRKVLEEAHRRDAVDDAPAPFIAVALSADPQHVLADADRTAAGLPRPDADLAPLTRRALGRPRVRAPDAG